MNYEYKTEELKMYYSTQADVINELAKEGWELITVSFNIGYFKRPIKPLSIPLKKDIAKVSSAQTKTRIIRGKTK